MIYIQYYHTLQKLQIHLVFKHFSTSIQCTTASPSTYLHPKLTKTSSLISVLLYYSFSSILPISEWNPSISRKFYIKTPSPVYSTAFSLLVFIHLQYCPINIQPIIRGVMTEKVDTVIRTKQLNFQTWMTEKVDTGFSPSNLTWTKQISIKFNSTSFHVVLLIILYLCRFLLDSD